MPKKPFFVVHGHFLPTSPGRSLYWRKSPNEYGSGFLRQLDGTHLPGMLSPQTHRSVIFKKSVSILGQRCSPWMEKHHPETVRAIADQEKASLSNAPASGNAMAQPYFHNILPLASERDKKTLILWGIKDYTKRFGHAPPGYVAAGNSHGSGIPWKPWQIKASNIPSWLPGKRKIHWWIPPNPTGWL